MRIVLPINKKYYLHELRQQMGSFSDLWSERFTGIILGNFIYVTHHAGYEWNRRITNEKNRAIGFVTKHGDGCAVSVLLTKGYLDPFWICITYFTLLLLSTILYQYTPLVDRHLLSGISTAFIAVVTYLECWFTERGQQGRNELLSLLCDPRRFWADEDVEY